MRGSDAMRISMKFDGLSHVRAVLDHLGAKLESKVIVQAMRQAMKPVLQSAKANAPVASGELRNSLRIVTQRARKRRNILRVGVVPGRKWFTGDAYYAGFVEFGFQKAPVIRVNGQLKSAKNKRREGYTEVPARPFLRPALDSNAENVKTIFRQQVQSRAAKYAVQVARQKLAAGAN